MKRQLEFFAADAMAWREAQQPGTEGRCCPGMPMTRLCLRDSYGGCQVWTPVVSA
jgi:hypothetical protein